MLSLLLLTRVHVAQQVINRSPHYKNKYIHHRTSVASNLTDDQVHFLCAARRGLSCVCCMLLCIVVYF